LPSLLFICFFAIALCAAVSCFFDGAAGVVVVFAFSSSSSDDSNQLSLTSSFSTSSSSHLIFGLATRTAISLRSFSVKIIIMN